MEQGSDFVKSHSKTVVEETVDARGGLKEDQERDGADGRKSRPGKLRRDSSVDAFEEPDDNRRPSTDGNESRRKSVSSSVLAYSGDEDDYDVRRESRVSKNPRRSPE